MNCRLFTVCILLVALATSSPAQVVKGTGTPGTIPVWTDSNTIGNSPLTQSGNDVKAAGNVSLAGTLNAPTVRATNVIASRDLNAAAMSTQGGLNLSSNSAFIALEASRFIHGFGSLNVFVGTEAGNFTLTGTRNAALGSSALLHLDSGENNVAVGSNALLANINGNGNTAVGTAASLNTKGNQNTAVGFGALAQPVLSAGDDNTAIGFAALVNLTSGNGNIALGDGAGADSHSGNNNIYIGSPGTSESNTIRIGTGTQSATYVAGISSTSLIGSPVVVNASGRLGVVGSSARFKQDIHDIGQASAALMRLHPVSFRYRPEYAGGNSDVHYGLIAEEVAAVYPNLVQTDKDGKPFTVLYHELPAMLLNEVQRQQRVIEEQKEEIEAQRTQLASTLEQLRRLATRMTRLESKTRRAIDGAQAAAEQF
jgi:hypothetical protein